MKKVYQTQFGGLNAPDEAKGNCWQACVASIMELPLEEVWGGAACGEWYADFNEWLSHYGFAVVRLDFHPDISISKLFGYHILEVKTKGCGEGETHAVVIHDGETVHDPNPEADAIPDFDYLSVHIFVPLDAARQPCCGTCEWEYQCGDRRVRRS